MLCVCCACGVHVLCVCCACVVLVLCGARVACLRAAAWFSQAWSTYVLSEKTGDMTHLGTNLAMEYSIWLTYQARWPELAELLGSEHMTKCGARLY